MWFHKFFHASFEQFTKLPFPVIARASHPKLVELLWVQSSVNFTNFSIWFLAGFLPFCPTVQRCMVCKAQWLHSGLQANRSKSHTHVATVWCWSVQMTAVRTLELVRLQSCFEKLVNSHCKVVMSLSQAGWSHSLSWRVFSFFSFSSKPKIGWKRAEILILFYE